MPNNIPKTKRRAILTSKIARRRTNDNIKRFNDYKLKLKNNIQ